MSGIYIPGMEMPKEAGTYRIEFDQCRNPYLLSENGDLGLWHIISVPDHGRLGDLDALEERVIKRKYACAGASAHGAITELHKSWGLHDAELMIEAAPTIIPADPQRRKHDG